MQPATYETLEKIYDGRRTIVFRARRSSDGRRVVLKTLRGPHPAPEQVRKLHRELEITRAAGAIDVLGIEPYGDTLALVMDDFGGDSLAIDWAARRPSLEGVLRLAVRIVDALAKIHERNIVHKDLNPSNIVWNAATGEVRIIDFGISSARPRSSVALTPASGIEGTLAYLPPEQTGRMNRALDHRADFYSLGATLYELLTGRPPFMGADPLEIVHAHIARVPPPPDEIDPAVPRAVANVVMKLLAKNAEDRYQSSFGIRADLLECAEQVAKHGRVEPFAPGRYDVVETLSIPQKLYGRQADVAALLAAFERSADGAFEMVVVSGYSGIGKTSLVHEIHRAMTGRRGHFVSGKLDQRERNVPYASLVQALGQLVRQLLGEPEREVTWWRDRILAAVGDNGRVLTDVLPELQTLLGERPPVSPLPPAEAEARFHHAVRALVRALAAAEHPLVLFLDDMQWADLPSIKLLERLCSDDGTRHLTLIVAYRDNEVSPTHPLALALDAVGKGRAITTLTLGPLRLGDVRALIADTLRRSIAETSALADACFAKTQGNPFFVGQLLERLHDEGLLRFDRERGSWRWDVAEIQASGMSDDVVDFVAQKIHGLSAQAQSTLELAACIGGTFDLATLAVVQRRPAREAVRDLTEAVRAGLLVAHDEPWSEREDAGDGADEDAARFSFLHDRVQQAAYRTLDDRRRAALDLEIGRLLLAHASPAEIDQRLFEIVDHLNRGLLPIVQGEARVDRDERERVADLDTRAGVRAKASAAYEPAFAYFEAALRLTDDDAWARHYDRTLTLHVEAAEAAYLATRFSQMDAIIDAVERHARSALDRARALSARVNAKTARNDLVGALQTGLQALEMLGVALPGKPNQLSVVRELVRTKLVLAGKSTERLAALPLMTDEHGRAAMRLMLGLVSAAYFAVPLLVPLLAFRMVTLTVRRGVAPESSYGMAVYGLVLCSLDELDSGYEHGKLALRFADRFDDRRAWNRARHVFNAHIRFWKEPLRESAAQLADVFQVGVQSGDLEYGAFGAFMSCAQRFFAGDDLSELAGLSKRYAEAIARLGQETSGITHAITRQLIENLTGGAADPVALSGSAYDERSMLAVHRRANDRTNIFVSNAAKAMLGLFFGRPDLAHAAALENEPFVDGAASTVYIPVFVYHAALAELGVWSALSLAPRQLAILRVRRRLRRLRRWAKHAPDSHRHRVLLVEAELSRVLGDDAGALAAYDQAIAQAKSVRATADEALANELAARFHRSRGSDAVARAYLLEARWAYQRWGATAKLPLLDEALGTSGPSGDLGRTTGPVSSSSSVNDARAGSLDFDSVRKASLAISGEIELPRVLRRLISIAVENAGAQRGILILDHDGAWLVDAELDGPDGEPIVGRGTPLAQHGKLAQSVVAYVVRTREAVVLDDAANSPFADDPHFVSRRPKSVLCAPLRSQGRLRGLLYLENDVTAGAFTADRIEVLGLLSAQAAISLENAGLYDHLARALKAQIRLTEAHRRFVPHQFLQSLGHQSIVDVELGESVEKEMSVLFSDIRGFTPLVEGMTPDRNIAFINRFISFMEPEILRHGGFVEGYIGDAIMALFDGSADGAVSAGVDMLRALARLNAERAAEGEAPVRVGIGVNTGMLTLGTIGGGARIKCGVIGDSVNLASRLESATKEYQVPLLVSERTIERLADPQAFSVRAVDRVRVVGRAAPVTLFEVYDADPPELIARKKQAEPAWQLATERYFARDFRGALEALAACTKLLPEDPLVEARRQRCLRLLANPPADDWSGVESLVRK